MPAIKQKIKLVLLHKGFIPGVIFLGAVLMAGALDNGLLLDDYLQRMMIGDDDAPLWMKAKPWDAFRLIPSDPDFIRNSQEIGINPWWGADEYQATFFRPISSLTMYLDYMLWPDNFVLMHLHSLLWFVIMCIAAWRLFLKLLPERHVAALAMVFFALDDAHLFPAAWLANRNSLISTTLSFVVLYLHVRWRREKWRPGAVVAPFMLAVALLAGEFALGICGFIFAHVLFMESGTYRQKLLRLLPYGAVVVIWRIIYNVMGYGVWGSDLYVDPLHSPFDFLEAVLQRLPVLLCSGFGIEGASVSTFIPANYHWILVTVSLAAVLFFIWVLKPAFQKHPRIRFLLIGTILSLIPACATFPHDRLLLMAAIGIFGILATVIDRSIFNDTNVATNHRRFDKIRQMMPALWLVLHAAVSPASLPFRTEILSLLNNSMVATTRSLPEELEDKTVVIVAAPDMFASSFLPLWRDSLNLTIPRHTVALYTGIEKLTVIRESDQSLLLEMEEGLLGVWTDALVRRLEDRFEVGQQIQRASTLFTVLAVNHKGNPTRVRATFGASLEDDRFSFWYWTPKAFREFKVPDRGDETTIQIDLFSVLSE